MQFLCLALPSVNYPHLCYHHAVALFLDIHLLYGLIAVNQVAMKILAYYQNGMCVVDGLHSQYFHLHLNVAMIALLDQLSQIGDILRSGAGFDFFKVGYLYGCFAVFEQRKHWLGIVVATELG